MLFQQGSAMLLDLQMRTVGLITVEQVDRAIVWALSLTQSLGVVWPQLSIMIP